MIWGNGDGTVNRRSLIGCQYWRNTRAQGDHKIYEQEYPGVEHYNMLSDTGPIRYIVRELTGHTDYPWQNETVKTDNTMKIRFF